ncbi:uroporphyrinogen-III synthase [Alphaproteobacteria bacterium]|nr:uroporphyrinogen-III synthase [Alphaproteobacteria bacterium]
MAKFTLIIRPQPDADRDVGWLNRYGVPALASPVMSGAPVSPPSLAHDLGNPADFTGIIFTSRHAVDAVTKMANAAAWIPKPAFVVGSATAAAAKQAGFQNIIIGSGGGAGLVEPIRQTVADTDHINPQKANLLWPSAREISFDMTVAMRRHDIAVQRLPAYQMTTNADLVPPVRAALAKNCISAVIAMSPRSIQILRANMDAAGLGSDRNKIDLIAGSDAIAAAAGDGWNHVYAARHPRRIRLLAIAVLRHRRFDLA